MSRLAGLVVVAVATCLSACSAHGNANVTAAGGASSLSTVTTTHTTSTYRTLSPPALRSALLDLRDLPPGYSRSSTPKGSKTFCDYKPPYIPGTVAQRDFTKGAGLSASIAAFILRQFVSTAQAKVAFDKVVSVLQTCHSDTAGGEKAHYSIMSAPHLGDDAIGLRIEFKEGTLLENIVLVGPAMVTVGAGGLMSVDSDALTQLTRRQVRAYEVAAVS